MTEPRFARIVARIDLEAMFTHEPNWYDIVNTVRRALIRANLREEALDFESKASVAVGRAMVATDGPSTFRAAFDVAREWVTLKLPDAWEEAITDVTR